MRFNSAFKGLMTDLFHIKSQLYLHHNDTTVSWTIALVLWTG